MGVDWTPDLSGRAGPRYRAIADALAGAVADGTLPPGDRLPPQRDLAWRLGVTVGTVTRAYNAARRRGLISGTVGRGSFVQAPRRAADGPFAIPEGEPAVVDLSLNRPGDPGWAPLNTTLAALSETETADLMAYQPEAGRPVDRAAGATWLGWHGLAAEADSVLVVNGAQHGLAVALGGLTRPGDTVLCDALTFPGLMGLCGLLGLTPRPVPADEEGMDPEALDSLCRNQGAAALYVMPTLHNPTTAVWSPERRAAVAAVARRHDLAVVEDDLGGLLPSRRPAPLAAHAPENTCFVSSVSKLLGAGLRTGYVHAPARYRAAVARALRTTVWMASPLAAAIATRWITDGTAAHLVAARRAEAAARQALAAEILGPWRPRAHPEGYHLWLALPEPWRSGAFADAAHAEGVAVTRPENFVPGQRAAPQAVRVCPMAPDRRADAETGLRRLAAVLDQEPHWPAVV